MPAYKISDATIEMIALLRKGMLYSQVPNKWRVLISRGVGKVGGVGSWD